MYNWNNTLKVNCEIQLYIFTITLKGQVTKIFAIPNNIDRQKLNISHNLFTNIPEFRHFAFEIPNHKEIAPGVQTTPYGSIKPVYVA